MNKGLRQVSNNLIAVAVKKILQSLSILILILTATFFLVRLAPGSPFDSERALPAEVLESLNSKYGLSLPVFDQYLLFIQNLMHFDFGVSYRFFGERTVAELLQESLVVSFELGFWALLIALFVSFSVIPLLASRRFRQLHFVIELFLRLGASVPAFIAASALIYFFSIKWGVLPAALWDSPASRILPALALAWRPSIFLAQTMMASLNEVLEEDFMRTALSKGLTKRQAVLRHGLKASFASYLTALGPVVASLLTGSFVVEMIFAIPGVGRYFVQSVLERDYPMILGVTCCYGLILVLSNLLTELLILWIDPRVGTS